MNEPQIRGFDERGIEPGRDAASIARDTVEKLYFVLAKFPGVATRNDHFLAFAHAIRDRLLLGWVKSARKVLFGKERTVVYLSAEYLIGPQLDKNLLNLGIQAEAREALDMLGLSLDELIEHEEEPGLGNGGLGRLAACYMESLATLRIPSIGHGLRYEFGIFDQGIDNGKQVELTDLWLRRGNPWEVRRHDIEHRVGFGGWTERVPDGRDGFRVVWHPERVVLGIPYDTPLSGHRVVNTNFLRLWQAVAPQEFDLDAFQVGEYWRAVQAKVHSETLTKVLYPNDDSPAGKRLRLEQQAFFVSCTLQDCIRLLLVVGSVREFALRFAIQLNDTHPALAVAELMRLLVDEHGLSWTDAWDITQGAISFTNHTLMPEALETWPVALMRETLPRHLEIIYEINARFLAEVRERFPGDEGRAARMSLIDEQGEQRVRMVHLATVASHHVNGVAALHSRLLADVLLPDFAEMYPGRFTNVTNGVTPRRFVALANPALAQLLDETIGPAWLRDAEHLGELAPFAEDAAFREHWRAVRQRNKEAFSRWMLATHGQRLDPDALFSAQCKRIHEYKRQLLNLLHVITLFGRIQAGGGHDMLPRTFVFAGKAAPGYRLAKLVIELIHGVLRVIDAEPRARRLLKVAFVPDFNVKVAQHIYPSIDLSEQLSLAGTEASGTGNMKFTFNGALTIGTLDGANIDIREAVGPANFFAFGLTAEQVQARRRAGYWPDSELAGDPELASAVDRIRRGAFSRGDVGTFAPLVDSLVSVDRYFVLADFRAYERAQSEVAWAFAAREQWTRSSILCTARAAPFSSDRAIREYAEKIWHVAPVDVALG